MGDAAALLREARRRAGLSQRQLGARAGVQQPVIAAYEGGRRQPSFPTLRRLLQAAGFDLDTRLRAVRALPDDVEAGRQLVQVLDLADHLPQRARRTLAFPRFPA
ncbi:MAG: hypothetical protein JWO68_593 [Actinomycetia bacterium]|nr:hypothetical protein [Actinomycetes bacterium]